MGEGRVNEVAEGVVQQYRDAFMKGGVTTELNSNADETIMRSSKNHEEAIAIAQAANAKLQREGLIPSCELMLADQNSNTLGEVKNDGKYSIGASNLSKAKFGKNQLMENAFLDDMKRDYLMLAGSEKNPVLTHDSMQKYATDYAANQEAFNKAAHMLKPEQLEQLMKHYGNDAGFKALAGGKGYVTRDDLQKEIQRQEDYVRTTQGQIEDELFSTKEGLAAANKSIDTRTVRMAGLRFLKEHFDDFKKDAPHADGEGIRLSDLRTASERDGYVSKKAADPSARTERTGENKQETPEKPGIQTSDSNSNGNKLKEKQHEPAQEAERQASIQRLKQSSHDNKSEVHKETKRSETTESEHQQAESKTESRKANDQVQQKFDEAAKQFDPAFASAAKEAKTDTTSGNSKANYKMEKVTPKEEPKNTEIQDTKQATQELLTVLTQLKQLQKELEEKNKQLQKDLEEQRAENAKLLKEITAPHKSRQENPAAPSEKTPAEDSTGSKGAGTTKAEAVAMSTKYFHDQAGKYPLTKQEEADFLAKSGKYGCQSCSGGGCSSCQGTQTSKFLKRGR
jgi:hypothetical protein